jgi:hypothetical protein
MQQSQRFVLWALVAALPPHCDQDGTHYQAFGTVVNDSSASRLHQGELCRFHHPGGLTLSIVGPRPHRSHITLDIPRERYTRPVGSLHTCSNWSRVGEERGTVKARQGTRDEPGQPDRLRSPSGCRVQCDAACRPPVALPWADH